MSEADRRHLEVVILLALGRVPKSDRGDLFDRNPQTREPAARRFAEATVAEILVHFDASRKEWSPGENRYPRI